MRIKQPWDYLTGTLGCAFPKRERLAKDNVLAPLAFQTVLTIRCSLLKVWAVLTRVHSNVAFSMINGIKYEVAQGVRRKISSSLRTPNLVATSESRSPLQATKSGRSALQGQVICYLPLTAIRFVRLAPLRPSRAFALLSSTPEGGLPAIKEWSTGREVLLYPCRHELGHHSCQF